MTEDERRLEAVLFAGGRPLDEEALAHALGWTRIELESHLERYRASLAGRGFHLVREEDGWVLLTRPEYAEDVARALSTRRRELSRAALETLSAVAYFEPVERSFVDRIRGVRSERSLLILEEEGLIEEAGRGSGPGRPLLWRTTPEFRRRFGLLDGLPELPPELIEEAAALRSRPMEGETPETSEEEPETGAKVSGGASS